MTRDTEAARELALIEDALDRPLCEPPDDCAVCRAHAALAALAARLDAAENVIAAARTFMREYDGPWGEYAPTDSTEALLRAALSAYDTEQSD